MAVSSIQDIVKTNSAKEWNRQTVADGVTLQNGTLNKFTENIITVASAIDIISADSLKHALKSGCYSGDGLTSKSARGAYSAKSALSSTNALNLGGVSSTNYVIKNSSYSGDGLTALSSRGAYSSTTAASAYISNNSNKLGDIDASAFANINSAYTASNQLSAYSAVNADKLDGKHASYFSTTSHNHNDTYIKLDGSNANSSNISNLINILSVGTSTPAGDDYYISQYAGGGTTNTNYYRRPLTALYNYIKISASGNLTSYSSLSSKNANYAANAAKLGNIAAANYAVVSGTYNNSNSGLKVYSATKASDSNNASKLGNTAASSFAINSGTYDTSAGLKVYSAKSAASSYNTEKFGGKTTADYSLTSHQHTISANTSAVKASNFILSAGNGITLSTATNTIKITNNAVNTDYRVNQVKVSDNKWYGVLLTNNSCPSGWTMSSQNSATVNFSELYQINPSAKTFAMSSHLHASGAIISNSSMITNSAFIVNRPTGTSADTLSSYLSDTTNPSISFTTNNGGTSCTGKIGWTYYDNPIGANTKIGGAGSWFYFCAQDNTNSTVGLLTNVVSADLVYSNNVSGKLGNYIQSNSITAIVVTSTLGTDSNTIYFI